jgi:hypothetical protein
MERAVAVICLLTLTAYAGGPARALGCTGFVDADETRVLVGNNEDYYPTDVIVRVRPGVGGRHACLLVGFGQHGFAMGGVNDQGLFFDSFSVPNVGAWRSSSAKEPLPTFRLDDIAERCANVDEVVAFCRRYNLPYFQSDRLFVADASGAAAVIEWGDDDVAVIRKEGRRQVVTNFYLAHPERGWYPCWRYDRATAMLAEAEPTWDLFRAVLSAVQQHWDGGGTRYSNIYELKARRMSLFNAASFDEYATFDLAQELARGERTYQIPQEYSDLRLVGPADKAIVRPGAVDIEWTGKVGSAYQVCFGVESQADRCDPPRVASRATGQRHALAAVLSPAGLGLIAVVLLRRRRAVALTMLALVPALGWLSACKDVAGESPTLSRSVSTRPRTTYSWKIVATAVGGRISTQSVVRTFTTGD